MGNIDIILFPVFRYKLDNSCGHSGGKNKHILVYGGEENYGAKERAAQIRDQDRKSDQSRDYGEKFEYKIRDSIVKYQLNIHDASTASISELVIKQPLILPTVLKSRHNLKNNKDRNFHGLISGSNIINKNW